MSTATHPHIHPHIHPHTHPQEKPHPASHDSSSECSLDHWLEVYWLVEEEYQFGKDADSEPLPDEMEILSEARQTVST